jgi:tetratricopeptide (TPR) repeat protein/transcriptional regulator with XRE-family HTH domain
MFLRRCRIDAGLTQAELAERAGISTDAISTLERGTRRTPHRDTVRLLADALALLPQDRAELEAVARDVHPPPQLPADARLQAQPDLRSSTRSPLIGRTNELSALDRHLAGDGPALLLLAGEPGIGKSRLLQEAGERGDETGFTVLQGGSQRRSGQEPYAPLVDILSEYVGRQTPARLRVGLQGCSWLVRLLPELLDVVSAPLPPGTLDPGQERRLVFSAVVRFLQNVSRPAGVLLLLDDLHWAGSDALDLLATLVSTAHEIPLRVMGAYRDSDTGPADPLLVAVADLARAGLVGQIPLGPLARTEATRLLHELVPSLEEGDTEVVERILIQAGGVPFFLVSWAQGLAAEGGTATAGEQVPWTLAQAIRQRVAALPEEAQELLGVAAVIGREVPQTLLLPAAEQAEETALAGLDTVCRARLLVDLGDRTYQFAHDVIREVVEADLGSARRTMLHLRVGEVLDRLPERERERRAAELAWHFDEGSDPERAVPYALLAGDHAARVFAHGEAEAHYRKALELARGTGQGEREAEALEKLGGVLRASGRYDSALQVLEQAATIYEAANELEKLGHIVADIGRVHALRVTPHEGLARLQPVLELFAEREPSPALGLLYAGLSSLLFLSGRYREQLAAVDRAADLAVAMGDERFLAATKVWRGDALLSLGDPVQGRRQLMEALSSLEAANALDILAFVLSLAGSASLTLGEFEEAREYAERALELAGRVGVRTDVEQASLTFGRAMFLLGDWTRARLLFEQAADSSLGWSWGCATRLLLLGQLELAEGNWEQASLHLEQCAEFAERRGHLEVMPPVHEALARRDLLRSNSRAAVTRLKRLASWEGTKVAAILPTLA